MHGLALLLAVAPGLAACSGGFQPLYGPTASGVGLQERLAQLDIATIPGRVGQRIRVRGISSLSLSNEPIFIIDGVRMSSNNGSSSFGDGGNDPSRLGDLSPEDIDNIEIVKGPSAATLYGTDAANGVVVITTKKGRAGNSRWTTYLEGGRITDRNWYSDNYTLAGMNATTKAKLVLQGLYPVGICGADFGALLRQQYDDYGRVIRESNMKAE